MASSSAAHTPTEDEDHYHDNTENNTNNSSDNSNDHHAGVVNAQSDGARSLPRPDPELLPGTLKRSYSGAAAGGGDVGNGVARAGDGPGAAGAAAATDRSPESGATASGPPVLSTLAHHHHHHNQHQYQYQHHSPLDVKQDDDGTDAAASINAAGPPPSSDTPPSGTDAGSSAKKRKTARGSRGVANLTPEQLERKRANDREAQRAIRERQRLRTEQYEREIAELKSKQPYQELQAVLRQKEAVEAQLAEVKRCLATITAMIQPILGPTQPLTAPAPQNPGSTPPPTSATSSASAHWQSSLSPVALTGSVDEQQAQQPPEMGLLNQQRYDLAHGLDLGSDKLGLDFLVDPNLKIARIQDGVNGAQDSPRYRHVPMKHDWTAAVSVLPGMQGHPQTPSPQPQMPQPPSVYGQPTVAAGGSYPFPSPAPSSYPHTSTSATTASSAHAAAATTSTPTAGNSPCDSLPGYSLTPRNCPPTCPLDSILLDFLAERRQRFAEGLSQTEILGPRYPSVSSLLNPAVSAYSHPLSKVFTDILARFPDLSTLPERVAVLYLMFLLMRWQVSPTRENHDRLPAWFRPLPVQAARDHPAWFDHIPFPRMRDKLVREYEPGGFPFDNFFIPFTSTLSVNWPYEDAYVLLASPGGDELMINPVFEQHLGILANWTLGEAFERAFPALRGCYNLKRGS